MTESTHTYTAVLIGSPDVPLRVRGGSITLDAGGAPHVTGTLNISPPSLTVLAALDPRLNARIRVTVAATFPSSTQSRVFNLGLRERPMRQSEDVFSLTLASDEGLLSDWKPLADDVTPRATESSLRSVINYVLNKVIPGTALAASPANNADATRYWSVTNLLTNPSFESSTLGLNGWRMGEGATSPVRALMTSPAAPAGSYALQWTAVAGTQSNAIAAIDPRTHPITPGRWYVFTTTLAVSVARNARAVIQWWSAGGSVGQEVLSSVSYGTTSGAVNTAFRRFTVIAQAPAGATHAYPYISVLSNSGGETYFTDAAMFYEGDELVSYFDPSLTAPTGYTTAWSNAAHASTSSREPLVAVDKESLTWRAGESALDFLAPLVQVAGYRLVCDESRTWTLRGADYVAPGSLSIRYGLNMIDGSDTISRDSGLWFDAAITTYTWTDSEGIQQTTTDAYALTPSYTRPETFEKTTPYPGPGFSQYAVQRAQGRGREVEATAVADWRAAAEQAITIVLSNAPTQVGATTQVTFSLDNDEMTVTTRTTDVPLGSIDLLVGTINSLTGTINSL